MAAANDDPATCEECGDGTFNAKHDASTECAEHNPCTHNTVKTKGTATQDAECEPGIVPVCTCTYVYVCFCSYICAYIHACAMQLFFSLLS